MSNYVYLATTDHYSFAGYFKVGITSDYQSRRSQIQSNSPFHIMMYCVVTHSNPYELEQLILEKYKRYRIRGEWLTVQPKYCADKPNGFRVHKLSERFADAVSKFMMTHCDGDVIERP